MPDPVQHLAIVCFLKGGARHQFVQVNISFTDLDDKIIWHIRHDLAFESLETMIHQPFTDKFFGELLLMFSALLSFSIPFEVIISRGIRGVDFIDKHNFILVDAEFVFRVNQY